MPYCPCPCRRNPRQLVLRLSEPIRLPQAAVFRLFPSFRCSQRGPDARTKAYGVPLFQLGAGGRCNLQAGFGVQLQPTSILAHFRFKICQSPIDSRTCMLMSVLASGVRWTVDCRSLTRDIWHCKVVLSCTCSTNVIALSSVDIRNQTDKNSSGDEIANVNFLATISHTRRPTLKYRKKTNLLRLTN